MLVFSHSIVYNSLKPHGLQHSRLPCPSASPRACSISCPTESMVSSNHLVLCHPFLLPPSIFPSIKVFFKENNVSLVLSLLRKQTIHISESYYFIKDLCIMWAKYWSFSFSISLTMTIQDWFPLGLIALISLQSKGFSRVFCNTTARKHQFFSAQPSIWSNSHIHTWLLEKP